MANNSQIELVVTVEVDKANQSIKTVNANLSSIEAAATRSARGASQGIDGMTASMVKGATAGNLLADAVKKAIDFAKEWTVEAAKQAAQADRAAAVTRGLAKAHGDGAAAATKAVEAIRSVGFTAADATTSVQKLIIADIGLDKAKGLARIAKDASALSTEGLDAAGAFEKLMLAIETGQSRGLRTMSLFPDLAKAEENAKLQAQLHGKTLSENEIKLVRYNAIVEAATGIQGAAADAAQSVDGQMAQLGRDVQDLRQDVGSAFQGELKAVVGHLKDMVAWLKDNVDLIEKFGQTAMWVAGVLATYALAKKILGIADAVKVLSVALAANPWALMLTGIVAGGTVIYKSYQDMRQGMEDRQQQAQNTALRANVLSGKTSIADLRKRGLTDDEIRQLVGGRAGGDFEMQTGIKVRTGNEPDPEALKLALEVRKRQRENESYFREQAIAAGGAGKTGYAKDAAEVNAEIARRTTFTDQQGTHAVALTQKAWEAIIDALQKKLQAFKDHFAIENRKEIAEYLKGEEEVHQRQMEFEAHRVQQRLQNDSEIAAKNLDHLRDVYGFEEQRAGFERDARLRQVEGADVQTLQQKVAVEQQKAQIEIDYLEKVHDVKQKLYDMGTRRMLMEEELTLKRLGYSADAIKARLDELKDQRQEIRDQADEANDAAIQGARENAANRTAQLVRDHDRQIFESLKQQAGGVFDALLQKSQSVWSAIGNSLKTALLTAIKDVVTSRVAAMLMALFTGQHVTFAGGGAGPGGSGGVLGGLGGILGVGSVPIFGGGSVPGGTPPFLPPGLAQGGSGGAVPMTQAQAAQIILGSGAGGGVSSRSGGGILGNLGGMVGNLKSFFGIGNSVQIGPGMATTWQAATLGQKLSSIGHSDAALLGGGMLAFDGLRRGGFTGLAETTAGGALIGFKLGGPLGAAIGAAAGAIAGIVRLFIKGATEKAHDKIKALYGVDISDKGVLQQIVDMAKQSCGGNLDMAIRTQQVRDLIQLYAMSTGQATKGMPAQMQPLSLAQSGGSLYQAPGYSNGMALAGLSGLPRLDSFGSGVASGSGQVVIQLDGPATTSLLRGEAVQAIAGNPRVVQGAVMSASKSNAGRRELASLQLSPGLVTS
jgi:hypothetical protein